ncbi:MAG: serine/threonine-protein kinase [Thermodesulfovibrionales bacterium]|nr:serine/threonine-protein kinase [Thermodesulfovibrionales bacterium]
MEKFGQYILLDKVGSGGMAELFKAKKVGIEGFERVLAIKRILPHLSSDEEFIDMFIAEAKLVARLSHKNITQVYDFGKIGQNYFIAMEYISGKDLRGILKRCKEKNDKFPVFLAVFIAKEIASGLSYAHRQKDSSGKNLNIIHRDVSPQNILISYEGEVRVVDFGIAKAGSQSKTTTGVLKGKLSYMSPEQAWGKTIDHRSDIFALGIVLYEMLTGERLFKGDSEINTLEKVRAAQIDPLPSSINADLPAELETKLVRALAREVTERYQNASDLEADLGNILFELLRTDPALSLKQFMHSLFKAEIEAEHKSESEEETISVQIEQEPAVADIKSANAKKSKTPVKTRPQELKSFRVQEPAKKNVYRYVISASLAVVALVIAGFIFWDKNPPPQLTTPPPVQPVAAPQPGAEEQKTATQMPAAPPLAGNEIEQRTPSPQTDKQQGKIQKTPEEENYGGLTINAMPWANVFVDGKPYGTTPKTIEDIKAGSHKVRLENPNFPAWETRVNISKGQTAKVSYKFRGGGKLVINASPWGNVYLDGALKGQTPLTIEKVSGGKHRIKIAREGFIEASRDIEISEGATEQISVSLKKEGG